MIPYLMRARDLALHILFPPLCFHCRADLTPAETALCEPCAKTVTLHTSFTCPVCRGRLPELKKMCHPGADYILASAVSYENPVLRSLIWQFKFQRRTSAARELAAIICTFLQTLRVDLTEFLFVPIPLHPRRARERGFNQADLLAQRIAACYHSKPAADILKKVKSTVPQTEMRGWAERSKNLSGCFSVARPELVRGRNIALVDDVWTSGTTMNEAARMLKEAGAKKIIAVTASKAG